MKDIKGFEGKYAITIDGRVYMYSKKKYKKTWKTSTSKYEYTDLNKNGKRFKFAIHRLVAETYIENPLNKKEVDHINGDIQDNRLENLQWLTRKENMQKHYETNTPVRNFRRCELYNRDGFIKSFNSILECARYCEKNLNISNSSIRKYLKYRDYYIIKV